MEHHLPLIGRSPLFANIDAADLEIGRAHV